MTISYVSSTAVESTSISSMPSHQAGDLLVFVAWNNASATAITVPSGKVTCATRSGGTRYSVVAYKIAASGSETSGTWTNANFVGCAVYRDSANYMLIGALSETNATSTTMNYANSTFDLRSGSSPTIEAWAVAFGAGALNSTAVDTPPSGMTNRTSVAGASSGEIAIHDSNGALTTWSNQNVTVASMAWHAYVFEIFDTGISKTAAGGLNTVRNMSGGMAA